MTQTEFKEFLKIKGQGISKYYTEGKVLGLNAINDIIKWAKGVERVFEVDLDVIVNSHEETVHLLNKVDQSYGMNKQKSKSIAAIKAYYEFRNGREYI
ncbi:hypothetical protein RH915_11120 [Serpentinicella sp. ANB-PHB4]|uniref:hypothetical protein n=1 Tax=Serpentinicella sp. ANB-PHB4 TaxID=3074076 RepID=UPI002855555F|nr:hypothetical protein [Serpentinicella sp. ANB-PHB4]MDR5660041.1 hypothetical protein [Serpentinicella sp. ANB-PHB4]